MTAKTCRIHETTGESPACRKKRCGGASICLYYSENSISMDTVQSKGDMRRRSSRCAFLLGGMILFILLNSALQGLVFCSGSDGHRAIESEHDGACRQARHLPAVPEGSRPYPSIVGDRGADFFCRDVHFLMDRSVTGDESRQKTQPAPHFGQNMPRSGFNEVPCFLPDGSGRIVFAIRIAPSLNNNSVQRC
jgi:hypothetical protein